MNNGVVEQIADPEEVYEHPASSFVAGFIGVSNLLPGEVVAGNGSGRAVRLDSGTVVPLGADPGVEPGERCQAIVRPEKLAVNSDGGAASVTGVLESSVYLGTATQLIARMPDGASLTALVPNVDEEARKRLPAPGEEIRLSWAPEHMHIVREEEEP